MLRSTWVRSPHVPAACRPSTVGLVRSGDRPTGNTAATDQPAAAAEVTGDPEDIDAAGPATTVQPTAGVTGDGGEPAAARRRRVGAAAGAGDAAAGERSRRTGPRRARTPASPDGPRPASRSARPARLAASRLGRRRFGRRPARARLGVAASRAPLQAAPAADRQPVRDAGGAGFARLTVLPAILIMAWLLVGLPLLLAGVFLPAPMLLIAVLLAVAPGHGPAPGAGRWPGHCPALPGRRRQPRRARAGPPGGAWRARSPWRPGSRSGSSCSTPRPSSCSAIPGLTCRRATGSRSMARCRSRSRWRAFGGAHPGLSFSSIGFSSSGTAVVPGLMSGLPLLLAGGVLGARHHRGRGDGPDPRRARGAGVRRPGRAAGRAAVGPGRGAGARAHASRAVHEQGLVQRDRRAGAAVRRAEPGRGRADAQRCGASSPRAERRHRRPPRRRPAGARRRPGSRAWLRPLVHAAAGADGAGRAGARAHRPGADSMGFSTCCPRSRSPACWWSPGQASGLRSGSAWSSARRTGSPTATCWPGRSLNSLRPLPELIGLIAAGLRRADRGRRANCCAWPGSASRLRTVLAGRPLRWLPDLGAAFWPWPR